MDTDAFDRRQVARAFDAVLKSARTRKGLKAGGNPQAALKARVLLRKLLGGKIRLKPLPDGDFQADWMQNVGALCKGLGTYGSGGPLQAL